MVKYRTEAGVSEEHFKKGGAIIQTGIISRAIING